MFRLLAIIVFISFIVTTCGCVFWYFRTPQPIGAYAQWNYARETATYYYLDYERGNNGDILNYWLPVADNGNGPAQTRVAEIYFSMAQSNPDYYRLADDYLLKAANKGLPDAQNALGVAFRNGLGVPQDKFEAYKWFSLAARQGQPLAEKNFADLTGQMTQKEQEQSQIRINFWMKNLKRF